MVAATTMSQRGREQARLDKQRKFRCAGCKRIVSWDFGAHDALPNHCDDCWVVWEQAAVLCSAMASACAMSPWSLDALDAWSSMKFARTGAVRARAWRALRLAGPESEVCGNTTALHWAIACSMLRNGEVTP